MLKNYLKIAFRFLLKHKTYSALNIFGLALGMACSLLILLYVVDELNYDQFHEKSDRIYRIVSDVSVVQPGPLARVLREDVAEVQEVTRMYSESLWGRSGLISHGEKHFYTDGFLMADPNFFEVFSFQFITGDAKTALADPSSIVITEDMARKYFGSKNPVGEILTFENSFDFRVSAIIENVPRQSHFTFGFVVPLENYLTVRNDPNGLEQWYNHAFVTYLTLSPNGDPVELERKLPEIMEKGRGEKYEFQLSLQPITEIHLHSHLRRELSANSDIRYIFIFSSVAILVLLIACINFMNLTTARSTTRAKEIGLRKVVGAQRTQLIRQFLSESVLFSVFSLLVALGLVKLILPAFNALTAKDITLLQGDLFGAVILLLVFAIGVGLFAGSYPALVLSAFKPVKILKGVFVETSGRHKKQGLRSLLIIVQFAVSIGLIICTAVISEQMAYIQNKNLGFQKEQVVVIPTRRSQEVVEKIEILKNEVANHPAVLDAALSSHTPGNGLFRREIRIAGVTGDKPLPVYTLWLDHDFFATYQIELVAGRPFSKTVSSDMTSAVILNETAIKALGLASAEEALGKTVKTDSKTAQVIGVTQDFHFMSLHEKIPPMAMHITPSRFYNISARIGTDNVSATLAFFEQKWHDLFPSRPFEYFFVDTDYDQQYRTEQRLSTLFKLFSGLAIVIACLGLLGLAAVITAQKTKEISIRKVLGASEMNLVVLLSRDFTKLAILANLIAWPLAYFGMQKWLEDFAYKISMGYGVFVVAAILALVIVWLTVGSHAMKAALVNPVDALRCE